MHLDVTLVSWNYSQFFTRHILQQIFFFSLATNCPQVVHYENKAMCHLYSTILLLTSKKGTCITRFFNGWLKLQFFTNIKNSHFPLSLSLSLSLFIFQHAFVDFVLIFTRWWDIMFANKTNKTTRKQPNKYFLLLFFH